MRINEGIKRIRRVRTENMKGRDSFLPAGEIDSRPLLNEASDERQELFGVPQAE